MRGKVLIQCIMLCMQRITPAYAGKRNKRGEKQCRLKDHPRLCGEKLQFREVPCIQTGSPPPMRGKGFSPFSKPDVSRITPAYAGKRYLACIEVAKIQDHPRLCGEKTGMTEMQCRTTGSPPPMRGKACVPEAITAAPRITPAYAGKSLLRLRRPQWIWDHPRLCGEKKGN